MSATSPEQMHAISDATRATVDDVLDYAKRRALYQDVPLDKPLTPRDLEARYGAAEGSLYHGELTLDQILFMRPVPGWAHYRTPVRGLYLCGAGAHPGGGIAGGAGLLAARVAIKD